MKALRLFLILNCILILSGCTNKVQENQYPSYEHFDLKDNNKIIFRYLEEDEITLQEYVMADIRESGNTEMCYREGLLYKIAEDDYILLDDLCDSDPSFYYKKGYTSNYSLLNNNKLYLLRRSHYFLEYTLNKDKTEKKEISFDVSAIVNMSHHLSFGYIEKIQDDMIYLEDCSVREEESPYNNSHINLKCSLETYKCELDD